MALVGRRGPALFAPLFTHGVEVALDPGGALPFEEQDEDRHPDEHDDGQDRSEESHQFNLVPRLGWRMSRSEAGQPRLLTWASWMNCANSTSLTPARTAARCMRVLASSTLMP